MSQVKSSILLVGRHTATNRPAAVAQIAARIIERGALVRNSAQCEQVSVQAVAMMNEYVYRSNFQQLRSKGRR